MVLRHDHGTKRSTLLQLGLALLLLLWLSSINAHATDDLPTIVIDQSRSVIRSSMRVDIAEEVIRDRDGEPIIVIVGDDIVVEFGNEMLGGSPHDADPDSYVGIGVQVIGKNVTMRGGRFSGFKVAIHAKEAHGLTIDGADVSDNFRQRLRSTPQREDARDWLWPHRNDENEWMHTYGAGMYIEDSDNVTVRNVHARNTQNGIILDRVNDSRIYDNDCSFLSGWGLAMWRSNRNTISRNAFNFCVRGYSHGVYNRGQDSAGILMFEQCSDNVIVRNSATHSGDGFFGFAGREALGEHNPREEPEWYKGRGNNRNIIAENDFSYAVAHGIEMTFSFDNYILGNLLVGNAICGIWGGFSQNTLIKDNIFARNGDMPYGQERGGINIEHGHNNVIRDNVFEHNACGVFLWSRAESRLLDLPWAKANHRGSSDNTIITNGFNGDHIAIQLRRTDRTLIAMNSFQHLGVPEPEIDADERSRETIIERVAEFDPRPEWPPYQEFGTNEPTEPARRVTGRERIIMTEWGPYDWASPLLQEYERRTDRHVYRLLAPEGTLDDRVHPTLDVGEGGISAESIFRDDLVRLQVIVEPKHEEPHWRNRVLPYALRIEAGDEVFTARGVVLSAEWTVRVFDWQTDPREDVEQWRRESQGGVEFTSSHLDFRYGSAGPSQLPDVPDEVRKADLPRDGFGTIARTTLTFPAGRWRIRTVSDDGIRVWLDDDVVIDDWTWHAPKEHAHEFELDEQREIAIRVEHFELDGYAILTLDIEAVPDADLEPTQ
jgi:parallel beta-helix repeat protein